MRPMKHRPRSGSAVVALLIIAVLILGSMLMVHTAALVSIENTSRALEIARENETTRALLERATREAAQRVFGPSGSNDPSAFLPEVLKVVSSVESGAFQVTTPSIDASLANPFDFPSWSRSPSPLAPPSPELINTIGPALRRMIGDRVAESAAVQVSFSFKRKTIGSSQDYAVPISTRLVTVPLSRFGLTLYDLPSEIGLPAKSVNWPHFISAEQMAPVGLVPARDPASLPDLTVGASRPAHFRYLATLSEAYAYVFSQAYLQRLVDYSGGTHFVQIGLGAGNPHWSGAIEKDGIYTLDVGKFDEGMSGSTTAIKSSGVICSSVAKSRLVLNDSGVKTTPILLAIAGPANLGLPPLEITLSGSITRPIVIVGYHVQLEATSAVAVNGAVLLDRDSVVSESAGPITVGHLSCWNSADSSVSVDSFRVGSMPVAAEELVPRVTYAVTNEAEM